MNTILENDAALCHNPELFIETEPASRAR